MSKRKKNYPPPEHIVNSYGADALRLYLINSPVVRADNLRFKEAGVKQVVRDLFLPWYHAYRLFVQCARAQLHQTGTAFAPDEKRALASKNIMDKWILAAFNGLRNSAQFCAILRNSLTPTTRPPQASSTSRARRWRRTGCTPSCRGWSRWSSS